jgi:gluconokinase
MKSSSYILVLDIGTSSVRAALYDATGKVLPETMVKNERQLKTTDDGGAEIDASEALAQVVAAIDEVLKRAEKFAGEIEFVAASSFWHSLVGINKTGATTTKVFGWADTRSREYISVLREKLNENKTHNRTGARFHSSYWTAKLLWLREEQPKVFKQTAKWLSFSDYVGSKLFDATLFPGASVCKTVAEGFHMTTYQPIYNRKDNCFTSVSMASGTGIFDIRRNDWDNKLLNFLKIKPENLPEIVKDDGHTFYLNEKYRKRWKRLAQANWFPAIGDGAANNIGANCLTETKAALMIGTSGAMRVAYEGEPPAKIPNGLWCYRIDRRRILIGGALSDGGGLYRWLKDTHKINDIDDVVEAEIERRAPDSHGLTFLPFLAGERSTGYNENARGAILGLHTSTTAVEIVQAALESVAYRFAEIFDQLNDVCKIKEIIASGGALRESPVWTQIICDVLNKKMNLPETREASSTGAVLLALETLGEIKNIAALKTAKGAEFKPNAAKHKIYRQARSRHEKFYNQLIG